MLTGPFVLVIGRLAFGHQVPPGEGRVGVVERAEVVTGRGPGRIAGRQRVADRFPLSPRVRRWRAILDKLEPPAARPELPPFKPPGEPSMLLAKKRGRRR